jgi:hypothetical protein
LGVAAARASARPASAAAALRSAKIIASGRQLGVSTRYIGANEGNVRFDISDLTDLGINTYRIYASMARWEWRNPYPVYGRPTIEEIKANPNVIDWAWWDNVMTNPPGGSDYWSSRGSTLWRGNARAIFGGLRDVGIRPVLALRNVNTMRIAGRFQPAWAPNPPVTAADWNVWWGYVFSLVYWLNVRNRYNVDDFEVQNEPNNRTQGWGGSEEQYLQLVRSTDDAIRYVYERYLRGRAYHVYAPVTTTGSKWPRDALREAARSFDSLDIHDYNSDISGYVREVRRWSEDSGHSAYPLWITEWGTYMPDQYGLIAFDLGLIQNLIRGSQPGEGYVYGSHIFSLYDWSKSGGSADEGFRGLIDAAGFRRPGYYAMRLGIRALQGGRPTYPSLTSSPDLMAVATKSAGRTFLLVTNDSGATRYSVTADLSALLKSGVGTMWRFDHAHDDRAVGRPVLAEGRVSFSIPPTAAVLLAF